MFLQLIQHRNKLLRTYPQLIIDMIPKDGGVEMYISLPDDRLNALYYPPEVFEPEHVTTLEEAFANQEAFVAEHI